MDFGVWCSRTNVRRLWFIVATSWVSWPSHSFCSLSDLHIFSAHCLYNICWCSLLLLSFLSALVLVSPFYLLVIFSSWMPFYHPVCSDFHGLFFIPPSVFHAKHHVVELILLFFVFWLQWHLPSAVSYIPMLLIVPLADIEMILVLWKFFVFILYATTVN